MVLESTIVCVDNSEFSRNGDFPPSRFAVQRDSVNMLCSSKVQANAESSVGLLTLAGRSARILVTSTRDLGQIFSCMHDVKHDGFADFVAGIQKAQLALKHRQNSLQRQRIVVFVSSPIEAPEDRLVRLAKALKKNNVAVDVVNIGLEADNEAKIDAFIAAVNSNDNSHALHVPAGAGTPVSEAMMNSRICADPDAAARSAGAGVGAGAGAGDDADFGGMDPAAVDPELAMVLRISMEEERARQAALRQAEAAGEGDTANAASDATPAAAGAAGADAPKPATAAADAKYEEGDEDLYGTGEQMEVDDDEEMLRRAIELSKAEAEQSAAGASSKDDKDKDKDKAS